MQPMALIPSNIAPLIHRKDVTSLRLLKEALKALEDLVKWSNNFQSTIQDDFKCSRTKQSEFYLKLQQIKKLN